MKRNLISVLNALMCSLVIATTGQAEAMHVPHSTMNTQKLHTLLAAKQLLTLRRKVTTTTTTTETEEYEVSVDDRPRLSDKLDPELKHFLNEIKENDRDVMELTVVNDTPMFFGLSEQFDPEKPEKVDAFVDHLTIKINGKEIPRNAVARIKVKKGNPAVTFSLQIKNNKLASIGTLFKNAVASVTDKIKAACLKIMDPWSIHITYKCAIPEQELRADEPISISTLMYKHPEMAEALTLMEKPELAKMVRFVRNYGRWPQWWDVEFHLPELEKAT